MLLQLLLICSYLMLNAYQLLLICRSLMRWLMKWQRLRSTGSPRERHLCGTWHRGMRARCSLRRIWKQPQCWLAATVNQSFLTGACLVCLVQLTIWFSLMLLCIARLQAQLHALASDPTTYTKDPDPQVPFFSPTTIFDYLQPNLFRMPWQRTGHPTWPRWSSTPDRARSPSWWSTTAMWGSTTVTWFPQLCPTNYFGRGTSSRYVGQSSQRPMWNGYIKVHLIDQQEVKRQALKRRAEEAKVGKVTILMGLVILCLNIEEM